MDVDELKDHLSSYVVDILKERGITKLFPPQAEAVRRGLFTRKNMVVAIPTASGKTLIAELAMIRDILEGGKCLYTVPLRALASEKFEEFKKWEKIGVEVGISMGDYESKDEWLADKDIIVATAEKADSLLRNKASWMKKITCLVVDEVHLLDSAKRGAVLEVLIAKMRKICPNLRIVALSATIPNADEIAEWLNAELVKSDWRPIPLYEGVFNKGKIEIYDSNGELVEVKSIGKGLEDLVEDCIKEGGQVLVFDSTRKNAENTALKLSSITSRYANLEKLEKIAKAILEENDGEMSKKLAECVRKGCAFHHAGLLNSQRSIIEKAFRQGYLKLISATPTLSAGVNLPARRVIIKSYYRFDGYSRSIKVMEYKQMAGRAGRPGMDERGEAIVVVKSEAEKARVLRNFIFGEVENVRSKLGAENHLRFHSLSLIAEGFANTIKDLEDFFSQTFFFHQNEISVAYELERIVLMLDRWGMVEYDYDRVVATELGRLVSRLYIDPLTGYVFLDELKMSDELSELEALHLICRTPDMEHIYVRKSDYDWLADEALALGVQLDDWSLREVKTALCLRDWINEVDEDVICSKYGIAPGDLRRIVETAEWLAHALARIADFVGVRGMESLVLRIRHGVKEELLELVELKGIGRVRARKLFKAGIRTKEDLIKHKDRLPALLGKKIAENVLSQIT
jgi:helicase